MSDGVRQVAGPSFEAIERQLKAITDGTTRQRMLVQADRGWGR